MNLIEVKKTATYTVELTEEEYNRLLSDKSSTTQAFTKEELQVFHAYLGQSNIDRYNEKIAPKHWTAGCACPKLQGDDHYNLYMKLCKILGIVK